MNVCDDQANTLPWPTTLRETAGYGILCEKVQWITYCLIATPQTLQEDSYVQNQ